MNAAELGVERAAAAWTPAVHALLSHFESAGFDGAPRSLSYDEERDVVSWVDGAVVEHGAAPADDAVVWELGRLLRRMHDAQDGFEAPADACWQRLPRSPAGDEVVCHNDPLGTNVVFRDGRPVALIDWELAAPGTRLADVAAAATWWVPLRRDEGAARWGLPVDRRIERLRLLADGYGLGAAERGRLLAMVSLVVEAWYDAYRRWGGVERREPWAGRWDEGRGELILAELDWLREHAADLESWQR